MFIEKIEKLYDDLVLSRNRPEDVIFRQPARRLSADTILKILANLCSIEIKELKSRKRGNVARSIATEMLIKYGGLTQRTTGEVLGIGTGVSVHNYLSE